MKISNKIFSNALIVSILLLILPTFSSAEVSFAKFKQIVDNIENFQWGTNSENTPNLSLINNWEKYKVSAYERAIFERFYYFNNKLYYYQIGTSNLDEAKKKYGYLKSKFGKGDEVSENKVSDEEVEWYMNDVYIRYVKRPHNGVFWFRYQPIYKERHAYKDKVDSKEEQTEVTKDLGEMDTGNLSIVAIIFSLLTFGAGFWAYQQLVMWWSSLTAGESITWNLGSAMGWSGATLVFAGITYLTL